MTFWNRQIKHKKLVFSPLVAGPEASQISASSFTLAWGGRHHGLGPQGKLQEACRDLQGLAQDCLLSQILVLVLFYVNASLGGI